MTIKVINLAEKFSNFAEHWQPKIVAQMNDYHVKLAKIQGEFMWHQHATTDEVFMVIEGNMIIELRDGSLELAKGELCVVPQGIEHRPTAEDECLILLIEPAGTRNTGSAGGVRTAPADAWI